jgi:hypothetical protein
MSTENNTAQIIDLLKDLADTCHFSVYVPSLKRDIKFKQLSTEQLKRVYKTAIDANLFSTEFTLTFYNIIKENCLEESLDINTLTIFDKFFIFLKTRIESLTPDYLIFFSDNEKQQYNLQTNGAVISLNDYYNRLITKNIEFSKKEIEHNSCNVICDVPTLKIENQLDVELVKNSLTETSTDEDLVNIIGNVFVNELAKFITFITIHNTTIDLQECSVADKAKVVEQLPATVIKEVLEYVENFKKQVQNHLVLPIKINEELTLYREIPYNASFFNI